MINVHHRLAPSVSDSELPRARSLKLPRATGSQAGFILEEKAASPHKLAASNEHAN